VVGLVSLIDSIASRKSLAGMRSGVGGRSVSSAGA
jgi:hypothetical protein